MASFNYNPASLRFEETDSSMVSGALSQNSVYAGQMDSLEQIAYLIKKCSDCSLADGRKKAVPGEGNSHAIVMFIGEGPGFQEDHQGIPFVGPAGKLLDGLLESIGIKREDVFIANMVKCRPPGNRDPAPQELAACTKYLDRQIELVDPKLIVTLGRFAFGRYFPGEGITNARGRLREKDGRKIFPVLHPAAVLRRNELMPTMIEDFEAISKILKGDADGIEMDPIATERGSRGINLEDLKVFQISFMDTPALSANPSAQARASGVNVGKTLRPEQLSLF
jgi:DNA polymerase